MSNTFNTLSVVAALAGATALGSCASGGKSSSTPRVDDEYHVIPPRDTMPEVMQAKLAHAQALMEGLALGDFRQIDANAAALVEISRGADWLVHDTVAYTALSETFRKTAQALHEDATRQNLEAATRDYNALVASCIACHRYLQAERPSLDMPGKVSKVDQLSRLRLDACLTARTRPDVAEMPMPSTLQP